MAWQSFDPNGLGRRGWVSIAAYRSHQCKDPSITITFARDLFNHLGANDGDMIALELGKDDHAGWLRMRRSTNGQGLTLQSRRPTSAVIRLAGHHFDITEPHRSERIPREGIIRDIDEHGPWVAVELPTWARRADL